MLIHLIQRFGSRIPVVSSTLAHLNPNSRAGLSARMRFRIPISGSIHLANYGIGWSRRDRGTSDAESRYPRLMKTTTLFKLTLLRGDRRYHAGRHGAGVAPVEPLLVASMGSLGTVARPLKPRIGLTTLLVRQDGAAPKVTNAFLGHCQATRQAFGNNLPLPQIRAGR